MLNIVVRFVIIWLVILLTITAAAVELDETRVSDLGWTDAHKAIYGWVDVSSVEILHFLVSASDDYLCMQNDWGQTALHLAVRQDILWAVQVYVDRRICLDLPNNDGDTPLHYAASWNRLRAATLLAAGGADKFVLNNMGQTALDDAKLSGNDDVIEFLFATIDNGSKEF